MILYDSRHTLSGGGKELKPIFESEYDELMDNYEKFEEDKKSAFASCGQIYKKIILAEKKCFKNEIKIKEKWSKGVTTRWFQETVENG